MFSVDQSTREGDGHVIVVPGGDLDIVDAAGVAAALAVAAARAPEIIVDLARTAGLTRRAVPPVDGRPAPIAVT
jgi:hypothetical protein